MNLISAMAKEFDRCKRVIFGIVVLNVILFGLNSYLAYADVNASAAWIVISCFLFKVIDFFLRLNADDHYSNADKFRRLALFRDGLGLMPSARDLLKVSKALAGGPGKQWHLGSYYDSDLPEGPARLAEITGESAFFTQNGARIMFGLISAVLVVSFLVVIVLFIVGLANKDYALMRLAVALLITMVVSEVTALCFQYRALAGSTSRACDECLSLLKDSSLTGASAHAVVADYVSATAKGPPIPNFVQLFQRKGLNADWKARFAKVVTTL